jgi:hypothetical protein
MGGRIGDVPLLEQDLSGTGSDFAGDKIDKRGLSGTVGADNRG